VILSARQVGIVAKAVKWANEHPPSVEPLNIKIIDPDDFDGLELGTIVSDAYGYVMWTTKENA
jgi:hypothetical protein